MNPKEKYTTNPKHLFDGLIWDIVDKFALESTTGKISHPWHWRVLPLDKDWRAQTFPGDRKARPLENTFFIPGLGYGSMDGLRRSYGSWGKVVLLEPKEYQEVWHFVVPDLFDWEHKVIRCSIELRGPVRVLLGPDPFTFYGIDSRGKQIELRVSGPFSRKDKSPYPLI